MRTLLERIDTQVSDKCRAKTCRKEGCRLKLDGLPRPTPPDRHGPRRRTGAGARGALRLPVLRRRRRRRRAGGLAGTEERVTQSRRDCRPASGGRRPGGAPRRRRHRGRLHARRRPRRSHASAPRQQLRPSREPGHVSTNSIQGRAAEVRRVADRRASKKGLQPL